MNLLVITRHSDLVERLRMAFEGAGHRIQQASDPLEALAQDAWGKVQLLLADSGGEPMDGYRLCRLLRGEAQVLFRNLPIFLILDHAPTEQDLRALKEADGDGFITAGSNIQQLLNHLGPVLAGSFAHGGDHPVPVLALGLHSGLAQRTRDLLHPYGMVVHTPPAGSLVEAQRTLKAPLLLLGLSTGGVPRVLSILAQLREQNLLPYAILLGQVRTEASQRKLILAGIADWVPLPLPGPCLLHACRRAIEWLHTRRVQTEYESAIHELRDRRAMLEIEAGALRNEVLTDPLTELLNRRAFDQNLEHAVHQWERHRRAFVLLLGDVDHFKLINDRFGHPVGDEVLRQLAVRIRSALRKSDLAFRIGGEEFAMLLMETSLKAGAEVAEKLRRRIDEDPVILPSGQTIFPTMSLGVGGPGAMTIGGLMAQVDKALYQAKHLGRNRVVVANEGEYPPRALSAGS
jgi:diguanylate cyclase (GGDEF)-like protein